MICSSSLFEKLCFKVHNVSINFKTQSTGTVGYIFQIRVKMATGLHTTAYSLCPGFISIPFPLSPSSVTYFSVTSPILPNNKSIIERILHVTHVERSLVNEITRQPVTLCESHSSISVTVLLTYLSQFSKQTVVINKNIILTLVELSRLI